MDKRPPRLTNDQIFAMNYIRSSHLQIPVFKQDITNLKMPFVVAVTPFPRDAPAPLTLNYTFQHAPICKNCTAIASNRYIKCPDGLNWLCQECSTKNEFSDKFQPIENSLQSKVSIVDTYFPRPQDDPNKILPPSSRPSFYFLVIERTDATINNGLFKATLDKIRETILTKNKGLFSVFVYDTFLHFPVVNSESMSFSMSTIMDLEDAQLPPAESCFFQLDSEKELITKYLDYLENGIQVLPPMIKLFDLVKMLNTFAWRARIPIVYVTSQVDVGTSEEYRNLSLEILRNTTSMKFMCLKPAGSGPDFSPLSEFAMVINARVTIFSQSQVNYLPTDIINTMLEPTYVDVLIFTIMPPCFKIADVKGNGLRRSEQTFTIPYMSPNDTVYFYIDYNVGKIDQASPSVQFQVRFIDAKHQRYIRTMSTAFTLVNNISTVASLCDYDVFIASSYIRCIDKAREFDTSSAALEELSKVRGEFTNDSFSKLFFLSLDPLTRQKIECALSVGKHFLIPTNYPMILGRSPIDISRFFAPLAYKFNLYSTELQGPFTLSGCRINSGALYIQLNNSRGLVLLSDNEDVNKWVEAVGQSPISDLIATICHERVIEIIAPSISADHTLYRHVLTCINTPTK
ncbi:hypothetical protein TRFO_29131 [Tritrichomonas foetus]|uniref:Sec23/Sec24 trunk domain containing protein n=1 Tax=Tritrichomonas foetus TaxID=1144522 RepID=A0A1J4JWJ7_9EUKA|nr:hypothetical protein TRFO_29131 [Tritrichomonas foetus]|eukprot:OHT03519.1 hypothetical protein TRFO_29131 [Tritrichomonas foetus]